MSKLDLGLLGGFQGSIGSQEPFALPTRKAQALLAYLAMRPDHAHTRLKLAGMLWSDKSDEQARHSLRQTLVVLRKLLSRLRPDPLRTDADTVTFRSDSMSLDVRRFESLVANGDLLSLEEATALYRGDFLEGVSIPHEPFEEWMQFERRRLFQLMLKALADRLEQEIAADSVDSAIQTATRLLSLDPLQETVHRKLMALFQRSGRRDAAARQYQLCMEVLQRELGVQPEEATRKLYQTILAERSEPQPDVNKPTVLLVEDEIVTRALLEGFLRSGGCKVLTAEDGAAALLQLGREQVDLMVLDINIPTLDGLQILEIVEQKRLQVPTICLTALRDKTIEARGLQLGAADFIKKPIQKDVLMLRVEKVLQKNRPQAVARSAR